MVATLLWRDRQPGTHGAGALVAPARSWGAPGEHRRAGEERPGVIDRGESFAEGTALRSGAPDPLISTQPTTVGGQPASRGTCRKRELGRCEDRVQFRHPRIWDIAQRYPHLLRGPCPDPWTLDTRAKSARRRRLPQAIPTMDARCPPLGNDPLSGEPALLFAGLALHGRRRLAGMRCDLAGIGRCLGSSVRHGTRDGIGFVFHGVRALADLDGPLGATAWTALLDDVHQFVRDQGEPGSGRRGVLILCEHNVVAGRVGHRA